MEGCRIVVAESDSEPQGDETLPVRHVGDVLPPESEVRALPGGLPNEVTIYESQYSGPLPSGEWFAQVEALCPGATETIIGDYTAQREHQRNMERQSLDFDRDSFDKFAHYQTLRLTIAGGLAALLAIAGIVLIATGYSVWGLTVLVGEITALTAVFFGQRIRRRATSPPPTAQADVGDPEES